MYIFFCCDPITALLIQKLVRLSHETLPVCQMMLELKLLGAQKTESLSWIIREQPTA
jgi:hypothetical protein